ncbi:MAG: G8 domain-containing protein [Chthoniobacterales bacterium]
MKFYQLLIPVLIFNSALIAGEIHSNGLGGGPWSDSNTWNGKKVPTATDTAVISTRDTVVFDRDDSDKATCDSLYIDPNGALIFKAGGKRVLNVAGVIETYGTIKMDASGDEKDYMELKMSSSDLQNRFIRLLKGSSLAVAGHADLPDNRYNAVFNSVVINPPYTTSTIQASGQAMIDLHNAQFNNVMILAESIDNTGSKPNERLNILQNSFRETAVISLSGCDTPTVLKNTFTGHPTSPPTCALLVQNCPLADIRENKIVGPYETGINAYGECTATRNSVEKCNVGIIWRGPNGTMKNNTVSECTYGIQLSSMTGSIEEGTIAKCKTAVYANGSITQMTSVNVDNPDAKSVGMELLASSMTLLNCNIKQSQVKVTGSPRPEPEMPWVQSMDYVIVKLKGTIPSAAQVDIKTTKLGKLPEGAADPNVRNSPAPVRGDMTPLPGSFVCLLVNSWGIGRDGKPVAAPDYTLSVLAPAAAANAAPKLLKTQTIRPVDTWYCADVSNPKPTVEITIP